MSHKLYNLISNNRHIEVFYDDMPKHFTNSVNYKKILTFFDSYIQFHQLELNYIIEVYLKFLKKYKNDCIEFVKTDKYPYLLSQDEGVISRQDYDLVLILSTLLTEHRFQIMENVYCTNCNDTLVIGIGPGIELLFINGGKNIDAYDLEISDWLKKCFPSINFFEKIYSKKVKKKYNTIYLIELLEHLENPYNLLEDCFESLYKNGELRLTTATNIPQFDHKYNFELSHIHFEKKLNEMGFYIKNKAVIKHKLKNNKFDSYNHYYTIIKK